MFSFLGDYSSYPYYSLLPNCASREVVRNVVHTRRLLAAALVMIAFITGGCWDRKELENRAYVLGMAIDYASPEPKGRYDLDRAFQQTGTRKYRLSYEMPKFKKSGSGEEGGYDSIVYSAEGESIIAASRAIASKTALQIFIEDNQIFLIRRCCP